MKKYGQLIVVIGGFFLLVFFRNMVKGNETPVVGTPSQSTGGTSGKSSSSASSPGYKDGTYTGSVADAYYGNIQVQAQITGGKISDITFLQYPNDNGTSRFINSQAMPMLKSEALQVQSAQVNIVSGASDSSNAFQESLASALSQAK